MFGEGLSEGESHGVALGGRLCIVYPWHSCEQEAWQRILEFAELSCPTLHAYIYMLSMNRAGLHMYVEPTFHPLPRPDSRITHPNAAAPHDPRRIIQHRKAQPPKPILIPKIPQPMQRLRHHQPRQCQLVFHTHIQPPVAPFERRLGNGRIAVGLDDGLHDFELGFLDDADEVEGRDGGGVFAEDEGGGGAVDAELGGVEGRAGWVGGRCAGGGCVRRGNGREDWRRRLRRVQSCHCVCRMRAHDGESCEG